MVGSVANPHGTRDFAPFLRAARDSDADVLALASGHAQLLAAMSALQELGLKERMKLVGLLTFVDDLHDMGLEQAQGLYLADSGFWTRDAKARSWAERFYSRLERMPSSLQAADYSAATQYLKAAGSVGNTDPGAVIRCLRSMNLTDMYVENGHIRDGWHDGARHALAAREAARAIIQGVGLLRPGRDRRGRGGLSAGLSGPGLGPRAASGFGRNSSLLVRIGRSRADGGGARL